MRSIIKLSILIVIAIFTCICLCPASSLAIEDVPGVMIKKELRPDPKGVPTKIKVGLYVIDISSVNDAEQTFTADIYASVVWNDPRLAGKGYRKMRVEELLWYPHMILLNRRDTKRLYEDIATIDPDGNVVFIQRLNGTFSFPVNLREFPFDKHQIPIKVITAGQGPEELEITFDESIIGRSKELSIADWVIGDVKFNKGKYYFEPRDTYLNLMNFTLDAHRRVGFYVLRIVLPLVLIVLMSWMVFWIDPSHLEAQVGISATSILTLIAFQFTVGVLLPRIAYPTRMDILILFSSILVFLALVEGVTTSALASKGRRELALKFDMWSRFLFPAAFITVFIVGFLF
jgi:hypothetical protein